MAEHRESIRTHEQLDDALELFEQQWSAATHFLRDFIANYHEFDDPQSLVEFIRVDIDRRYASDCEVDLFSYFATFPKLSADSRVVSAIAFEDFRARRSGNLSVTPHRYSWLPGIGRSSWFSSLKTSSPRSSMVAAHVPLAHASIAQNFDQPCESQLARSSAVGNEEPRVGVRFGDFQLLAVLGQGAFSTVFLATQIGLASRYVALKVVRRALDEPTHLARLQHTGIVPLFSLHRIGAYSALCMPYFGSATLADWIGSNSQSSRDGQSLVGTVQSAQTRLATVGVTAECNPLNAEEVENVRVWNATGAQPLEKLRTLDARQSTL